MQTRTHTRAALRATTIIWIALAAYMCDFIYLMLLCLLVFFDYISAIMNGEYQHAASVCLSIEGAAIW